MKSLFLLAGAVLVGSLCAASAVADAAPGEPSAPTARLAEQARVELPEELLTLPEPAATPAAGELVAEAPVPSRDDPTPADEPGARPRLSFDAERGRPAVPAIKDGDRDKALLVRLRFPF